MWECGQSITGVCLNNSEKRSGYLQTRWMGCASQLRAKFWRGQVSHLDKEVTNRKAFLCVTPVARGGIQRGSQNLEAFLIRQPTRHRPMCACNVPDHQLVLRAVLLIDEEPVHLRRNRTVRAPLHPSQRLTLLTFFKKTFATSATV